MSKAAFSIGLCLLLAGCSHDNPELTAAKGRITLDGNPLPDANIFFRSEDGKYANAVSNADGEFEVTRNGEPGASIGSYLVSVSKFVPPSEKPNPDKMIEIFSKNIGGLRDGANAGNPGFDPNADEESLIPRIYAADSTSGLTAVVDADASKNEYEFKLVSQ